MIEKILDLDKLAVAARGLRGNRRRLVLTNGCFDLLHVGHVRYLEAARRLGDALAVAVNGDHSVRLLKGQGRPLNPERDRAEVLAALQCVDYVVIFGELRATQVFEAVKPAIYVKGGDYTPESLDQEERAALLEVGSEIRILPFQTGYSTSGLVRRMNTNETE